MTTVESLTLEETAGKFISDVSFRVVEDQLTGLTGCAIWFDG